MNYHVDLPYPPIRVLCPNEQYGQMILDNVGGMNSEMSAISLYMYNHIISGEAFKDLNLAFLKIGEIEMHHLDMFSQLAFKLGMDPRLWSGNQECNEYWSPAYNNYPNQLDSLLINAITNEQKAIDKYRYQVSIIQDPYIVAILNRIILDEELHVKILENYYYKLIKQAK